MGSLPLLGAGSAGASSGGPEFTPASLSPTLWTAARLMSVVADGTPVLPLDFSGNGRNMVQATESRRPQYFSGIFGSQPVFRGDGVDDTCAAAFTLNQPNTVFMVMRLRATSGAQQRFLSGPSVTTNHWLVAASGSIWSCQFGLSVNIGDIGTVNYHRLYGIHNGAGSSGQIDDDPPVTGDFGTAAFGGITMFSSGNTALPAAVDIAELIVLDREATVNEIAQTMAFLLQTYP